ncbi:MAG: redox-sensing transcriptional repressor Rex [Clostridia bacterium]|nr:redox-sensing transcriptional repressor Rex [Clostridia bacterium]
MKSGNNISKSVISRLPRYYRFLGILLNEGIDKISSNALSERMGLTASQIRQDLNQFGGFGQQGYGYNVKTLRENIGDIIGVNCKYDIILVGAGNLGRAIAQHINFSKLGFNLTAIFDSDEKLTGIDINSLKIKHFSEIEHFCKENTPKTAILCIPTAAVKPVADKLIECGINSFWNFSHYNINDDHPDALVENVHLKDSLLTLCYNITNSEGSE